MLKNDVLELILNKYGEIKEFYSKSLNITSKILSLLSEKEPEELNAELATREKNIYSAEIKLKEIVELSKQYARDKFLKEFSFDELKKTDPELATKIRDARLETVAVIEKHQKLDEQLKAHIQGIMTGINDKLKNIALTKKMKKKYGASDLDQSRIDKNI